MASFSKKLCRAVERRKLLYDRSVQQRVKKTDIENAWDAVALECGESVHSVKTRWRNIRKVLLRFMSKNNTPNTRKTRAKDYYLYDELQFLLPHLTNHNHEEYVDSDQEVGSNSNHSANHKESTPVSVKDHTDDSNECSSTVSVTENGGNVNTTPTTSAAGEKRKRETNQAQLVIPTSSTKPRFSKYTEQYIITEVIEDDVSAGSRFRRANNLRTIAVKEKGLPKKQDDQEDQQKQEPAPPEVQKQQQQTKTFDDPLLFKIQENKRNGRLRPLRTRSKSLYLERPPPAYENSTDSDTDYNPPPRKKLIVTVNADAPVATTAMVTRKKAASIGKPEGTTTTVQPEDSSAVSPITFKGKAKESVSPLPETSPVVEEKKILPAVNAPEENVDFEGIDMTLIAAAAEAEAAAAADDMRAALNPVVDTTEIAVQCNFQTDEEDNEFIQRVRKWQQVMTQRQKIIFRRGIYQAYIDVYDNPKEFDSQKSVDKFQMTQSGVPAIFTGMTPVELRLVRHLAMAVTGHKITASTSPFSNTEAKAPPRPIAGNQSINKGFNEGKLPTLPTQPTTRTPNEKVAGVGNNTNANSGNGSSGILRTTAIALTNHNVRSGACMPRILRKVVRVGNNTTNDGNHLVQSQNNIVQRSGSVVRPRLVTNYNSGDKQQRVYRILSNGVVARHSAVPSSGNNANSSPNNTNSPTTVSGSYAIISNSGSSKPSSSGNMAANQYRQILPKLPTLPTSSSSQTSSNTSTPTLTTTAATKPPTGQTITINGEPKLPGISIRRHVATPGAPADSRSQMARRYSVCGSGAGYDELYSATRKADPVTPPTTRRTVAALPMVNIGDQQKGTARIRYTHSSVQQPVRTTTLQPKFAMPSPISGSQISQSNDRSPNGTISSGPLAGVPLNEPIPIAMNTWHTTQSNTQGLHEVLQPPSAEMDPISVQEEQLAEPNEAEDTIDGTNEKQNCIIASDVFENFVIKNEPLDMEEEE